MFQNNNRNFIVVLFSLFLLISPVVSAEPMQFQDLPGQNQFRITYGNTEITFGNASRNFSVNGIKHGGKNVEFGKWPTVGTNANFWLITFYKSNLTSSSLLFSLSPSVKSYTFDPAAGLTLHFDNLDLPGEADSIDVTVTVKPLPEPGMTGWRMDVENRSSVYAITEVLFPIIVFSSLNGNAANSTLLYPRKEGLTVSDPISNLSGAPTSGIDYPGPQAQMQFSAYYQKTGDRYYPETTRGAGLYMGLHDSAPVWPKKIVYAPNSGSNLWTYYCTNYSSDAGAIGADYLMAYDHIFGMYEGDWYDASQIYRGWALEQDWASKGPIAYRSDTAQWYKEVTTVHRANQIPAPTTVTALELAGRITGPAVVQWYDWGVTDESDYPARLNAKPGFVQAINDMRAVEFYTAPYIGGRQWQPTEADWPTAEPFSIDNIGGNPIVNTDGAIFMCYGTSFWRDYQSTICADIVTAYGVNSLYLDQLGGVGAGCYDASHGHSLGLTLSSSINDHLGLEEIAAAVYAVDPNVMLWGEASSEMSMDVLHGRLMHDSIFEGCVPAFSAVYHDYVAFSGRTMNLLLPTDPDGDLPAMDGGYLFAIGAQLGRIWASNYNNYVDSMNYIATLTSLKSQASEYLMLGRMLRPPVIDAATLPVLTSGNVTLPAIMASVWQNQNGQLALAVTNMNKITQSPLTFNVEMDLDEYGVKTAGNYDLYEFGNPALIIHSTSSRLLQFSLTLSSKEAKVYELSVPVCSGFSLSDTNLDCVVNLDDFWDMADDWMVATDFTNLQTMTEEWLTCTDLSNPMCE